MDVFVLSSQNGVIGVFSTLNAAKNSVEMLVWTNPEDNLFEGHQDWSNAHFDKAIYTVKRMKLR
jgi:hypothetical protein